MSFIGLTVANHSQNWHPTLRSACSRNIFFWKVFVASKRAFGSNNLHGSNSMCYWNASSSTSGPSPTSAKVDKNQFDKVSPSPGSR